MARLSPENSEPLIRQYAAGTISWRELQKRGFNDYIEVLAGLADLGLRPPIARLIGPNLEARKRGRSRVAELLRANSA